MLISLLEAVRQAVDSSIAPLEWAANMKTVGDAYSQLVYIDAGNNREYTELAIKAYSNAEKVTTLESMPRLYYLLAQAQNRLFLHQKDRPKAHIAMTKAFNAHNFVYESRAMPEGRQNSLLGEVSELRTYDAYCLVQMGNPESAVETLEQGRARALRLISNL